MKRLILTMALVLGLASCGLTMQQKAATACTARATAIEALVVANNKGKLSAIQQAKVTEAINLTKGICTDPTAPTITSAQVDILTQYLAVLESNAAAAK